MSEKTVEEKTAEINTFMLPEAQEDAIAWHEEVRFKYVSSTWVVFPE